MPQQSNLSKVYRIQGPKGPIDGTRPSDAQLTELRRISQQGLRPQPDLGDRPAFDPEWRKEVDQWIGETRGAAEDSARELASSGLVIDGPVDVESGDYWKVMAIRRGYGYGWSPSYLMASPATTDAFKLAAPEGAILIPRTVEEDPNYQPPQPLPNEFPAGVIAFGPAIEGDDFPGAYNGALAQNTVPVGTRASHLGQTYVLIERGRKGTFIYRKMWLPVSLVG
ncbi:MAG: hypothetical protein ABIG68_02820 [Acidobacteriota bacterium]